MNSEESSSGGDDRSWEPSARRSKRVKTNSGRAVQVSRRLSSPPSDTAHVFLDPILDIPLPEEDDFENTLQKEDYFAARARYLQDGSEPDAYGYKIRPLTMAELHGLRGWLDGKAAAAPQSWTNGDAILTRRLKLQKLQRENVIFSYDALRQDSPQPRYLTLPHHSPAYTAPNEETVAALYSIHKTPYKSSFASRLIGDSSRCDRHSYLIHSDWETQAPWMELLLDIRLHYSLSHPESEQPNEVTAPIDYVSLQRAHISQVHDLLNRAFWPSIDISDSLQYSPTQCTIVATYKRLVVGVALLSSPEETYLTYLVVRPGWENANIASIMLYHLITANPRRDITLHVSANNPALLLYNKFGFKAEEFIVGFYEDYLAKESRACKNAFRLRLRR